MVRLSQLYRDGLEQRTGCFRFGRGFDQVMASDFFINVRSITQMICFDRGFASLKA